MKPETLYTLIVTSFFAGTITFGIAFYFMICRGC